MRRVDTVARLGGDEFIVLLEDIEDMSHATQSAERIQAQLREPLFWMKAKFSPAQA